MEILEETTVEVKSSKKNKGKQPKTHKRRSPVWLEFEQQKLKKGESEEDVKAICKHCGELYLCHTRKHGGDVNKMMAWKFDQNKSKRDLAHMIVVDELPFSFVKNLGKWMHIRCAAHVINRIVQDGMKKFDNSIEGIRCAVKWIKKSGTRIEKFTKCAQSARCDSTKSLILDCPTRWNSTYAMLKVAHVYEDAFTRYDQEDVDFGTHIRSKGHSVPTTNDWTKAKKFCHFLKAFYEITLRIFGTKCVTSHTLVNELATIHDLLRKRLDCEIHDEPPVDKHLYDIAKAMQPKFDKYYCEVENINFLVYFAFVLDPKNKYDFLDVIMEDHYRREGLSIVTKKISYIKDELKLFFKDYVCIHAPSSPTSSTLGKRQRIIDTSDEPNHIDIFRRMMKRGQSSNSSISELDKLKSKKKEDMDMIAQIEKALMEQEGTDIAKITRKPDKNRHENGKIQLTVKIKRLRRNQVEGSGLE
nr:zinc finger BED domain-containing protein RICESLEEPER 2-like [Tanacetum cinerariifolium]